MILNYNTRYEWVSQYLWLAVYVVYSGNDSCRAHTSPPQLIGTSQVHTITHFFSHRVLNRFSPIPSAESAAVDHRRPLFSVFMFWLNFVHKHWWSPYSTLRAATKELTGGRLAKKWICDKTNDLLWFTCVLAALLFKKRKESRQRLTN